MGELPGHDAFGGRHGVLRGSGLSFPSSFLISISSILHSLFLLILLHLFHFNFSLGWGLGFGIHVLNII